MNDNNLSSNLKIIKSPISVFSTYSLDTIIDKNGKTIKIQPGGPLLFLEKVLKDIKTNFTPFHGQTINIEIHLNGKGETGKILNFPTLTPIPIVSTRAIVISTIFNEWGLVNLKEINNPVYLDIQGYVRDKEIIGKKHIFKEIEYYSNKIFCIKGTEEEISYLPKTVYEDQKKRLIIITHGEDGVEYYSKGKKYFFKVKKKITSSDTIGAGDSFFGYFVGFFNQGMTLKNAIESAMRKTEAFLEQKHLLTI